MAAKFHDDPDMDLHERNFKEEHDVESQFRPAAFMRNTKSGASTLLVRVLACIGLLFVVQKISLFYVSNHTERYSRMSGTIHIVPNASHPIDDALAHNVHNTGVSKYGTKSIVVASMRKEETDWFHEFFSDWKLNIYVVDDKKANNTVLKQGGHEGAVFLTYIINHYYDLPDVTVFHHAGRYQWHNEDPMFDAVNPLKNLRLPYVQQEGYVNLRCTWKPGCPVNAHLIPGHRDGIFENQGITAEKYKDWFPERKVPNITGANCCAQFAVTKEQIRLRPIVEYERIRQWLWTTLLNPNMSGRVTEYLWHVIFNKPDIYCVDAKTCFCEKFGLCNLNCPTKAVCEGRWYEMPFWVKLPADWPHHGQDWNGIKKYGWWQKWYPNETFGLEWMSPENLFPKKPAKPTVVSTNVTMISKVATASEAKTSTVLAEASTSVTTTSQVAPVSEVKPSTGLADVKETAKPNEDGVLVELPSTKEDDNDDHDSDKDEGDDFDAEYEKADTPVVDVVDGTPLTANLTVTEAKEGAA